MQARSVLLTLAVFMATLAGPAARLSAEISVISDCSRQGAPAAFAVIDDFTAGPGTATVPSTGTAPLTGSGPSSSIAGGVRRAVLNVVVNPFGRPAGLDIREGHLVVDTGIRTHHSLTLLYGWNADRSPADLNLDLRAFDRLRLHFDAVDRDTAGAVVVWTGGGIVSVPLGAPAGEDFCMDLPFADFAGDPADWSDVQHIAIVIQSGGLAPAHDYAIRSISAVVPNPEP